MVGDKINEIIKAKHLKQSAVGQAAGYDIRRFNDLIHGRRRITADDIIPICKVLDITPNELFEYGNTENT